MIDRKILSPVITTGNNPAASRNVAMTKQCLGEFEAISSAEARAFLIATMKKYACAKTTQDEPQPEKFKRLGYYATGGKCGKREVCAFKRKVIRVYGCEETIEGVLTMVLTSASDRGKSGSGKRQDLDIAKAAKRFGSWHDGK